MQRKELEEQLEALKTALMEKQPSSNVITILKRLQVEVAPTEELLRVRLCPLFPAAFPAEPRVERSKMTFIYLNNETCCINTA
jgi:hypothetical protein